MLDVRRFYPFRYLHFERLLYFALQLYKCYNFLISDFTSKVEKNKQCGFFSKSEQW